MKSAELTELVNRELDHLPRGARGSPQRELRMLYNIVRRHSLGPKADSPMTCGDVLRDCLSTLECDHTDYRFEYDAQFFG